MATSRVLQDRADPEPAVTSARAARAERGDKRWFLLRAAVGLLAFLVGGAYLGLNLYYNNGALSAPLDDAFIHLQYGRQIGQGEWYRYNDGDPISTGASSLLYPILLGLAHWLGADGLSLLAFALAFGLALLVVTAVLAMEVGRLLAGRSAGVWCGVLVATNGAFVWGATSGMEVALLAALLVGSVLAFLREARRGWFWVTPVLLVLMALTRPEGLMVAAALALTAVGVTVLTVRQRRLSLRRAALSILLCGLPFAAGAGQVLFYRLATGTTAANGVRAKSVLYRPVVNLPEVAFEVATRYSEILTEFLLGIEPLRYLFPGAILFAALGVLRSLRSGRAAAGVSAAALAMLFLVLPSLATFEIWSTHAYRYFQPLFPLLIILAVVGVAAIASLPALRRTGAWVFHGLIATMFVFTSSALPYWAVLSGQQSAEIREQQIAVAGWLDEHLPADARVAINDAGALRYFGERYVIDLVGLVTNGFAEPYRHGTGSVYEALEALEPAERPDYFVIYPHWFSGLESSGVLASEIERFELARYPMKVAGGREVVVYRSDWTDARSGDAPASAVAGRVRDRVDVADLANEEAHGYELHLRPLGLQPDTVAELLSYSNGATVADAGRTVWGGESFTVAGFDAGEPVAMVMRTMAWEAPPADGALSDDLALEGEFALEVVVDGRAVDEWRFQPLVPGWHEPTFVIPAEHVQSDELRVELRPVRGEPRRAYAPFHYWFLQ